jgi:hypothetical protein
MSATRWLAEHVENDAVAFRIGRDGAEIVAEWVGLVRLVARRDGTLISFEAEPGAPAPSVAKVRRGSARLLLRHLEGKLALHGAAVAKDGRAAIFLGRSGHGKSTMAAALCDRRATVLLADDAVAIDAVGEGYVVVPSEEEHWLDGPASRALGKHTTSEAKAPVACANVAGDGASVALFVDLVFDDRLSAPILTPVSGIDAVASLVPQLVRFVVDESDAFRRELDDVSNIIQRVSVVRVERPRSLDLLDSALDLVTHHPALRWV